MDRNWTWGECERHRKKNYEKENIGKKRKG